jgi:hypothetical protein
MHRAGGQKCMMWNDRNVSIANSQVSDRYLVRYVDLVR